MTNYYVNTNECCNRRICCEWIPFIIFAVLFTFVLGLIIGATTLVATIGENLTVFIILAVILFVLAVVSLIVRLCSCRRRRNQQCE